MDVEDYIDILRRHRSWIAGPAFAERDVNPYINKGGTGFGVRTMLNWLKEL